MMYQEPGTLTDVYYALDRIADTLERIAAQTAPAMPPAPPAGASSATAAVSEPSSSFPGLPRESQGATCVICKTCGMASMTYGNPTQWAVWHHDTFHRPNGEPWHFTMEPA